MMSISTTLFGEISHASLFFTGQLRNPVEKHWPRPSSWVWALGKRKKMERKREEEM